MDRTRFLQGVGSLGVVGGSLGTWHAFRRQMCAAPGGVEGQCAPNIAFIVPGLAGVICGIAILAYLRRRG